jgi:hypothetical protein
MGSVAAMAAGAGFAALRPESAQAAGRPFRFNVQDHGASGNGTTSDSAAVQAAIDAAYAAGGGVVEFPAGTYLLTTQVTVTTGVSLEGVGWYAPRTGERGAFPGSWISVRASQQGLNLSPLKIVGQGSAVRRLAFTYPEQGITPVPYPWTIIVGADDVVLEDLHLHNVTQGILISGFGRTRLERISGQPMTCGIQLDDCYDTPYVDNVHFWPYFTTPEWTWDNADGIRSLRCDNPMFSNIFCFGYRRALWFGSSGNGPTSKFHVSNADLDANSCGVYVDGARTTGQMSNVTIQGRGNLGSHGMYIGAESTIFAGNLRITDVAQSAVRIDSGAGAARLLIEGLWVDGWNRSRGNFPGIEIVSGNKSARCWIGITRIFENPGASAPPLAPSEQFILDGAPPG